MLTAQQVIPFLDHEDTEVRQHALLYLSAAHDPAPATADDLWRAIDKLPPESTGSLFERLELLPQTDDSVARCLTALPDAQGDRRQALLRVLRSLDIDLLRRHRDAIRAVEQAPAEVSDHLDQRLALADEPVEPLWDRLIKLAADLDGKQLTEADALAAERLIEALARRPEFSTEKAVALLRDESVRDWREVIAADLAGEMRLRTPEAIDALIDKLTDEEADILWETAAEALVRAGDPAVVARLADRFAKENWGFRISAAGVFGRIKHPDAEAAILRLLPGETDKEVVTFLVASLLDLCPTDSDTLGQVRQLILDGRYEPGTADLRSMLASVAQMVGYDLPESAAWREQREADRKRWETGAADTDGLLAAINTKRFGGQDIGPVGQILGLSDARPLPPLRPVQRQRRDAPGRRGASTYAPAQPSRTIRRPNAKVGRNDPCPCGSGRKFKKCCMKD